MGALRCVPALRAAAHWVRAADVDYRTKTFSCSRCGADAYLSVVEPIKETGMGDYRLDEVEWPEHHPAAVDRLSGGRSRNPVDWSAREQPGRKVDSRR